MNMIVQDIDDALKFIKRRNDNNENTINRLRENIRELQDEYDKDEEIQKMKIKVEQMRSDYYRGFPISEEEEKQIKSWKKKHDEEVHGLKTLEMKINAGGCIGGRYEYRFVTTSLGVIGTCVCSCGAKYTFQDI